MNDTCTVMVLVFFILNFIKICVNTLYQIKRLLFLVSFGRIVCLSLYLSHVQVFGRDSKDREDKLLHIF